MNIHDELADRTTRMRALEIALVAHALTAPEAFPRRVTVSPTCALVLEAVYARHYADPRYALVACVVHHVAWEPLDVQRAAVAMAEDVAGLAIQDLASIGDLETVVRMLADERRAPQSKAKAA